MLSQTAALATDLTRDRGPLTFDGVTASLAGEVIRGSSQALRSSQAHGVSSARLATNRLLRFSAQQVAEGLLMFSYLLCPALLDEPRGRRAAQQGARRGLGRLRRRERL